MTEKGLLQWTVLCDNQNTHIVFDKAKWCTFTSEHGVEHRSFGIAIERSYNKADGESVVVESRPY